MARSDARSDGTVAQLGNNTSTCMRRLLRLIINIISFTLFGLCSPIGACIIK